MNTLSSMKIKVILLYLWVGFYPIRHEYVEMLCIFTLSDILDDAFRLFTL